MGEYCNDTEDCLFISQEGREIQKICYREMVGVDRVNFCDCSNWYGFVGDSCDDVTTIVQLYRLFHIVSFAGCVVCFLSIFLVLLRFFTRFIKLKEWKLKIHSWNVKRPLLIYVLTFLILSVVSIHNVFTLYSLFVPDSLLLTRYHYFIKSPSEIDYLLSWPGIMVEYLINFAFALLALTSTLVATSWIEICSNIPVLTQETVRWSRNVLVFSRASLIVTLLFFPVFFAFLYLRTISALALSGALVGVSVWIMFIVARYRFVKVLTVFSYPGNGRRFQPVLRLVNTTSSINLLLWTIIVISLTVSGILNQSYMLRERTGKLNMTQGTRDVAMVAGGLTTLCNIWYVHNLFLVIAKDGRSRTQPGKSQLHLITVNKSITL